MRLSLSFSLSVWCAPYSRMSLSLPSWKIITSFFVCLSIIPIRNFYYLFLSLSVSLLFQYLNLCFFLCVLGFVGTKFCTALSLSVYGGCFTNEILCVFFSLSPSIYGGQQVYDSRASHGGGINYEIYVSLCLSMQWFL